MRFCRACLVALLLAFGFAQGLTLARAADINEAIAHFTAGDFDETLIGVSEVAASGSPRAAIILRALQAAPADVQRRQQGGLYPGRRR